MNIYNFPVKFIEKDIVQEYQPVDLDYVVSIGPIISLPSEGEYNEYCYFNIYIKIGQPIEVGYNLQAGIFRRELYNTLSRERSKLIEIWKKGIYNVTTT